ncbi:MAG: hypothetical protein FIA97_10640 [Methylococcaceae bacterium]|nr:hypothetical protein [Methylococcaceae bacterium]
MTLSRMIQKKRARTATTAIPAIRATDGLDIEATPAGVDPAAAVYKESVGKPQSVSFRAEISLWWRFEIRSPDGRDIEVDVPSGISQKEARDYADRHFGGGTVEGLVPLDGIGAVIAQLADPEVIAFEHGAEFVDSFDVDPPL